MDTKALEEVHNILNEMDPLEAEKLQHYIRVCHILTGIYNTKSTDIDAISNDICFNYGGIIPIHLIKTIVNDYLPHVLGEAELISPDGILTPQGKHIAIEQNRMFASFEPNPNPDRVLH